MRIIFTVSALLAATISTAALAQPDAPPGIPPSHASMADRLKAERVSAFQPGLYGAGDGVTFVLAPGPRGKYLLRFEGSGEKFILSVDRASLGAKLLKYDTGATALRVSVWGGFTLYTQDAPQGLPATRQGNAPPITPLSVSTAELQAALNDEANHLSYVQNVSLKFSADPSVMNADAETRGRAFEAMTNAGVGIERFLAAPGGRQAFLKRINSVKVTEGGKPTVALAGQTLLVSFVPDDIEGHASSLAIQQELGKLLAISPKDIATK